MPNVLEALRSAGISCPMGNGNIKDTGSPEVLKELGQRYLAKSSMVPGDLVTWKKGLRDSRFPEYGKPVVVIEIVPGQRRPLEGDASGNHCGELIEMRIGVTDDDGDLTCFWVNANRFDPYRESEPA